MYQRQLYTRLFQISFSNTMSLLNAIFYFSPLHNSYKSHTLQSRRPNRLLCMSTVLSEIQLLPENISKGIGFCCNIQNTRFYLEQLRISPKDLSDFYVLPLFIEVPCLAITKRLLFIRI